MGNWAKEEPAVMLTNSCKIQIVSSMPGEIVSCTGTSEMHRRIVRRATFWLDVRRLAPLLSLDSAEIYAKKDVCECCPFGFLFGGMLLLKMKSMRAKVAQSIKVILHDGMCRY